MDYSWMYCATLMDRVMLDCMLCVNEQCNTFLGWGRTHKPAPEHTHLCIVK